MSLLPDCPKKGLPCWSGEARSARVPIDPDLHLDGHSLRGWLLSSRRRWLPGHHPHLCYHPEFSFPLCVLCTVKVNGRQTAFRAPRAAAGMQVESNTEEINAERRAPDPDAFRRRQPLLPSCEKRAAIAVAGHGLPSGHDSRPISTIFPPTGR